MADVNGKYTPSGREVELVTADDWMDMSVTDLFDQRITLNNRYAAASQYGGNTTMLRQIRAGIQRIDAIINYKEQQKRKNINKRQKDIVGLI